jgi:hypothetical protein
VCHSNSLLHDGAAAGASRRNLAKLPVSRRDSSPESLLGRPASSRMLSELAARRSFAATEGAHAPSRAPGAGATRRNNGIGNRRGCPTMTISHGVRWAAGGQKKTGQTPCGDFPV